jgi:hypothetical protein
VGEATKVCRIREGKTLGKSLNILTLYFNFLPWILQKVLNISNFEALCCGLKRMICI